MVEAEEDDDDEPVVEIAEPEPEPVVEAPVLELKPRDDAPVQLEVTNILASDTPPEPSAVSQISSMLSSVMGSKEEKKSNPREAATESSVASSFESQPFDDSMSQLLEDARMMTEEEKESKKGGILSDAEGTGVKSMVGEVLSTIVTADFFLVCGFLLWFLLGIFARSVFNDDTIQIAFNNNFEKFVQPALGVLMIAALGGNFFKEKEEEYDL